jgi:hypothetical protein
MKSLLREQSQIMEKQPRAICWNQGQWQCRVAVVIRTQIFK